MNGRRAVLDVSSLAPGAFGSRSVLWWGTVGLATIETTMFALSFGVYFYLRLRNETWPPNVPPPMLHWGTINLVLLLVSAVPNALAKKAAERIDLGGVRLWLVVCLAIGVGFNVIRCFEFTSLQVMWNTNAYGSIVWFILGMHTVHVVTDVFDTGVLTLLMFTGPIEEKRFVDVSENAFYWYWVVLIWIPVYFVIYWAPRLT